MRKHAPRRSEVFVVRLLTEYLEVSPPAWRGEIEHVGRGGVIRFASLNEMDDQIRHCVQMQFHASKE